MAELLSATEIQQMATQVPEWSVEGKTIKCLKTFKGFVEAVAFVNQLVEPAEAAGHHPDLEISYNKVTITLTTHDAGGLTKNDFSMAEKISSLS
ncbi:MAG: 4a-hydroxytetrahydrobiopterin dehydratase [Limnospira sp. PMC 1291.21]|uniref:4a-hydroxytetrahydrobiopterin dehydratase n=1 Tax=Limnospira TaxID=2596745 RepID=UPI001449DAB7|nr:MULTISPECIES: 4a-hydroxytetrahydrobiopterin dehydratase [unclassified Limnospira]QJB27528.1 4a-hydroxytetrahydrobiopterin dehydratase [Limnospira fusiformis SAG 85.79]MDT9178327.1 4a-hydroxytetrahydrobiopterin dehydratase [Limnospira sp. PMC 1238.20]MDT9193549.1 4a-hydroxytetrahydrobiopterin dehydratase [Limnospira sp. PMC 1245.20]MDT9198418.1 4a-hydroxytetrahydrobiopterin dehydratase [Limnospira sp. PMC 1042.18]MDT9203791.1 4a-hydroxytetrahydrobiopterin dehydratase [Limnospira sp. PMC 1243